jgi:hypothetical protein
MRATVDSSVLTIHPVSRADHDPAIAQALRHVAQLRPETLSKVTGPLTDAEFALIIGPLLFQAVIARRPVTDEFLDELAAVRAARSDCCSAAGRSLPHS